MGDEATNRPNDEAVAGHQSPADEAAASGQPNGDTTGDEPSPNHEQVERTTYPGPEPGTRHDTRGERVPEPGLDQPGADGTPDSAILQEHSHHAERLESPPTGEPDEHDLREQEPSDAGRTGVERDDSEEQGSDETPER